jgi:hypothetical protein
MNLLPILPLATKVVEAMMDTILPRRGKDIFHYFFN